MEVEIRPDENGQNIYKIFLMDSPLEFLLVERDSKIKYSKEAVYILMDKFRQRLYIGETGASKHGGVINRFRVHKWNKNFWNFALVIIHPKGGFGRDADRKWYEWRLSEIAKEFANGEDKVKILSRAGEQDMPYGADQNLNVILSVCRLIGISWAFCDGEHQESVPMPKKSSKTKPEPKSSASRQKEGQLSQTQLAKFIAKRAGKPGSSGHIWLMLAGKDCKNGRRCRKDSEWRKPLEEVGVKFGNDDYVIEWHNARIPS